MDQQMKVDSEKLRLLRETRGWSQEHLAAVAGISARTLQRMEADGSASADSRMAVAAALGLDAAELCASPAPTAAASNTTGEARFVRKPATVRRGWLIHLALYVLVCGALLLSNLLANGAPGWAVWPALGWGLGVTLHGLRRRRASPYEQPAPFVGR